MPHLTLPSLTVLLLVTCVLGSFDPLYFPKPNVDERSNFFYVGPIPAGSKSFTSVLKFPAELYWARRNDFLMCLCFAGKVDLSIPRPKVGWCDHSSSVCFHNGEWLTSQNNGFNRQVSSVMPEIKMGIVSVSLTFDLTLKPGKFELYVRVSSPLMTKVLSLPVDAFDYHQGFVSLCFFSTVRDGVNADFYLQTRPINPIVTLSPSTQTVAVTTTSPLSTSTVADVEEKVEVEPMHTEDIAALTLTVLFGLVIIVTVVIIGFRVVQGYWLCGLFRRPRSLALPSKREPSRVDRSKSISMPITVESKAMPSSSAAPNAPASSGDQEAPKEPVIPQKRKPPPEPIYENAGPPAEDALPPPPPPTTLPPPPPPPPPVDKEKKAKNGKRQESDTHETTTGESTTHVSTEKPTTTQTVPAKGKAPNLLEVPTTEDGGGGGGDSHSPSKRKNKVDKKSKPEPVSKVAVTQDPPIPPTGTQPTQKPTKE